MGVSAVAVVVDDVQARRNALLARASGAWRLLSIDSYSAESLAQADGAELAELEDIFTTTEAEVLACVANNKAELDGYLARVREKVRPCSTAWLETLLGFTGTKGGTDAGQAHAHGLEPILIGPDGKLLGD